MKLFYCSHCDQIFRSYKMYSIHRYSLYNNTYNTTSITNNSNLNKYTFSKKIEDYNTPSVLDTRNLCLKIQK